MEGGANILPGGLPKKVRKGHSELSGAHDKARLRNQIFAMRHMRKGDKCLNPRFSGFVANRNESYNGGFTSLNGMWVMGDMPAVPLREVTACKSIFQRVMVI
ncbi:MAG: hypothetical protein CBB70_00855 [Planctomycetaceae bacterium TMED10]|nr:MAG: hypothetical protein CBB70_00855 [Planctomycetaceae bacterium TMED10]